MKSILLLAICLLSCRKETIEKKTVEFDTIIKHDTIVLIKDIPRDTIFIKINSNNLNRRYSVNLNMPPYFYFSIDSLNAGYNIQILKSSSDNIGVMYYYEPSHPGQANFNLKVDLRYKKSNDIITNDKGGYLQWMIYIDNNEIKHKKK
jgi:hypothetical protein